MFAYIYRHNDLAAVYRYFAKNQVNQADLRTETRKSWNRTYDQTDIPRLRKGKVGAQASIISSCNSFRNY